MLLTLQDDGVLRVYENVADAVVMSRHWTLRKYFGPSSMTQVRSTQFIGFARTLAADFSDLWWATASTRSFP